MDFRARENRAREAAAAQHFGLRVHRGSGPRYELCAEPSEAGEEAWKARFGGARIVFGKTRFRLIDDFERALGLEPPAPTLAIPLRLTPDPRR